MTHLSHLLALIFRVYLYHINQQSLKHLSLGTKIITELKIFFNIFYLRGQYPDKTGFW
jgi:hypothetical protein